MGFADGHSEGHRWANTRKNAAAQGQEEVDRLSGISADAVWLHTEMSDAVRSAGWDNWNLPHREKTSRYAEFRSTGPGAKPEQRAKWAKQLAETEATEFIAGMVLHGQDGWNPTAVTGK